MSDQNEQPPGPTAPGNEPPPGQIHNKRSVPDSEFQPVTSNLVTLNKRDHSKDYQFGNKTESVRSDVINEAIQTVSETQKFYHRSKFSHAPINFKAIDRTLEPYLTHIFSNKYQYLTINFGGRTLLHEILFKIHYHLLAYIFAIDQRSKTHDGDLELDRFSSFIHAKIGFEKLKVDAFMAPIFEMIADYQPEMHDITDIVKCYVYTDFANNPVTGDTQYVIPNDARYTTPDFQGMFRMLNRLITQTDNIAQPNQQQVFTCMWNLTDLTAAAAQQQIGANASLRHALYPLLPGQPFVHRQYFYGDPAQQGLGGNANQGQLFLNHQKELLQSIGFPNPVQAGNIDSVALWCGLRQNVNWVLSNQSTIYPAIFSDGNNTLVNLAQLRKTTLAWRIEHHLSERYTEFKTALDAHEIRVNRAETDAMRANRELLNETEVYLLFMNAFNPEEQAERARAARCRDAFAQGLTRFRAFYPEVPNDAQAQPLNFIIQHNLTIDAAHYTYQDPIGQFIANWARQNGTHHLWDDHQYVTTERTQNMEGLKELAVYQLYHPAVGPHPGRTHESVTFRGPYYDRSHLPIRYISVIENEFGSYRAAVVSHYQTRAKR